MTASLCRYPATDCSTTIFASVSCSHKKIRSVVRIFSTKNVLPHWVGPITRNINYRNINSRYPLISRETSLDNLGLLTTQCWGFSVSLTAAIVRFRSLLVSISVPGHYLCYTQTFLRPENTAAFSDCFLSWLFNRCTWRRWSFKESNSGFPQTGQSLLNLYGIFTTREPPTYWRK